MGSLICFMLLALMSIIITAVVVVVVFFVVVVVLVVVVEFMLSITGATMGSLICFVLPALMTITVTMITQTRQKYQAQVCMFFVCLSVCVCLCESVCLCVFAWVRHYVGKSGSRRSSCSAVRRQLSDTVSRLFEVLVEVSVTGH